MVKGNKGKERENEVRGRRKGMRDKPPLLILGKFGKEGEGKKWKQGKEE